MGTGLPRRSAARMSFSRLREEVSRMSALQAVAHRCRVRRRLPVVLYRQTAHRECAGARAGRAGDVRWRPFFLNSWVPREGISRDELSDHQFGSVEAYHGIAQRVVAAAEEEGLIYRPELVQAPTQHHRLPSADPLGGSTPAATSAAMKQRLMELYFRDGGDLTDADVLVQAAADCGLDAGRCPPATG